MEKQTPPEQDTIFDEAELLGDGYDKHVRRARNTIFVVASVQFVFGLVLGFSGPEESKWISIGIMSIVAGIFAGLGFWASKKPYQAILIALILFCGLILLDVIFDPASIFKGIILKIFIIVYLIMGVNNARQTLRIKQALGKE
ncbi:MAG: hypothetical protein H7122_00185 [Chitinophagaceae bacterium]|nr:hypothetical protein [Chitinophagaceae bacterium]